MKRKVSDNELQRRILRRVQEINKLILMASRRQIGVKVAFKGSDNQVCEHLNLPPYGVGDPHPKIGIRLIKEL